jgi:hypothetical protein
MKINMKFDFEKMLLLSIMCVILGSLIIIGISTLVVILFENISLFDKIVTMVVISAGFLVVLNICIKIVREILGGDEE